MSVLLNLDTLVVRPKIAIDGKLYEILSPDEIPVLTSHLLATKGRRMEQLMEKAELEPIEREELQATVREIGDAIMEPVPADVRARLKDPQRNAVIEAFTGLLLSKKVGTAAANLKQMLTGAASGLAESPSIGAKSSPGSSASTAARRRGGSKKPRSRS